MARTKRSKPGDSYADGDAPPRKQPKHGSKEVTKEVITSTHSDKLLSQLLGMPLQTFIDEYFEKKPLIIRKPGDKDLFESGLFSRSKLLQVLREENGINHEQGITLCQYKDGVRTNYEPESKNSPVITYDAADKLLSSNYSAQFYQPQRHVTGLFRINAAFEACFGTLAGASAYLTPPGSQALAPHHDDVEVFILQTEGRKHWKLYKPLVELAGEHSSDLSPDEIGEPIMETTLEEGDVMYFPRGTIHEASTDDTHFSTHVTVSIYQHQSWANFLEVALPRVIRRAFDNDVSFRKGLPVNYLRYMGTQFPPDNTDATAFRSSLLSLLSKLPTHVTREDLHKAADEAASDFFANRLPPRKSVSQDVSPTEENRVFRWIDRSHIRIAIGEDEMGSPSVSVVYSTQNCAAHHMGRCDCADEDDEEEDEDEDEDEEEELPNEPHALAFPADMAPPLLKLYSSYPEYSAIPDLVATGVEEVTVRGMLLRLWSEGLLEVEDK